METLIVTIKKKNKAAFTKELLKSFDFLDVREEKKLLRLHKERKQICTAYQRLCPVQSGGH